MPFFFSLEKKSQEGANYLKYKNIKSEFRFSFHGYFNVFILFIPLSNATGSAVIHPILLIRYWWAQRLSSTVTNHMGKDSEACPAAGPNSVSLLPLSSKTKGQSQKRLQDIKFFWVFFLFFFLEIEWMLVSVWVMGMASPINETVTEGDRKMRFFKKRKEEPQVVGLGGKGCILVDTRSGWCLSEQTVEFGGERLWGALPRWQRALTAVRERAVLRTACNFCDVWLS